MYVQLREELSAACDESFGQREGAAFIIGYGDKLSELGILALRWFIGSDHHSGSITRTMLWSAVVRVLKRLRKSSAEDSRIIVLS